MKLLAQTLLLYRTASGKCPFEEWLGKLKDSRAKATVDARYGWAISDSVDL